jgi:hypothetical protein
MLALLLALGVAMPPQSASVGRGVGQFFPDLELPTVDGSQTVRLSELRGSRLLLIEFASW